MQDRFLQPGRAIRVDAPAGRLARLADNISAAHRTVLRHVERFAVDALCDHPNHFRNHVATALDQHRIADLDAQTLDLILVVQGRARDRHAADHHASQVRHGSQSAGSTDLYANALDHRLLLPGGKLDCDGPPWSLGRPAQYLLLCDGVNLGHHAVDLIRQALALRFPFLEERQ